MKSILLLLSVAVFTMSGTVFPKNKKHTIEIYYFKAKLCRCKAKVCNALELEVKSVIEKEFPDKNIEFKTVWIAEEANKPLVEKYNAKPQTVVMVEKKRKKETVTDLTEIVHNYSLNKNKEQFEKALKTKIEESLK